MCLLDKFLNYYPKCYYSSKEESHKSCEPEKVHRLLAEGAQEPQRQKVQETVHKPVDSELALSVFSFLVVYRLFCDSAVAGVFGKVRDITVHFPIDFNVLYNFILICLETAVHIVQFQPGNFSRRCIVQF